MPRAIATLAMIETTTASSEMRASCRCSRRNGSSADDSGSCSTAITVSPERVGKFSTRVTEASLKIALPSSSLFA